MKSIVLCVTLLGMEALSAGVLSAGILSGRASFKVCVIDSETCQPLCGMRVRGFFENYSRGWGISSEDNKADAVTDGNGIAFLAGDTEKGVAGYQVAENVGFYYSGWTEILFDRRSLTRLGRWMPNDIVSTTRLDRIVHPIPLWVAKSRRFRLEEGELALFWNGDVAAYDLLENDWLPPLGKGQVSDIRFTCRRTELGSKIRRYSDGTVTNMHYRRDIEITFPRKGNGVMEIQSTPQAGIKLRTAPETGYVRSCGCWQSNEPAGDYSRERSSYDRNRCYGFRIRTKVDASGRIKSAIYGKIYSDFRLCERRDGSVEFIYYLNPAPNDRNLEWDMKNNLCPQTDFLGREQP